MKKKDNFIMVSAAPSDLMGKLLDQIRNFSCNSLHDYELRIFATNDFSHETDEMAAAISSKICSGALGTFRYKNTDIFIDIYKQDLRNENVPPEVFSNSSAACMVCAVKILGDGNTLYAPALTGYLFKFQAHAARQVISSIKDARGQLPELGHGVVFVELDISKVRSDHQALYMEFVEKHLGKIFQPDCNTRIHAIVLTTEIIGARMLDSRGCHQSLRHISVVNNPYSPLSHIDLIPHDLGTVV